MPEKYIFVFNSKSQAFYAEAQLRKKGYSLEIRPTPESIARGCSYSLAVYGELSMVKEIRNAIAGFNLSLKGVYRVVQKGYRKSYRRVE